MQKQAQTFLQTNKNLPESTTASTWIDYLNSNNKPPFFPLEAAWHEKEQELGGHWGEALKATTLPSAHRECLKTLQEDSKFKNTPISEQKKILNAAKRTIQSANIKHGFTPEKSYLQVIKHAPIVSIDLVIFDHEGKVLLGKRRNQPAKGTWFVPGGRLRKNETMEAVVGRISDEELGAPLLHSSFSLVGVFNHIYNNNFCNNKFGTHYVCFAYSLTLENPLHPTKDNQHDELRWWDPDKVLTDPNVHPYTKNYFHPAPWNLIK